MGGRRYRHNGPVDQRARAIGINHVALEVSDIDRALAFYGEVFELTLRGRGPGSAFVDLGDQFVALTEGRSQPPDTKRHFGLVVDDKQAVRQALEHAGAEIMAGRGLSFRDPFGNHVQVVAYSDVQFKKEAAVLRGMGLDSLTKSESARAELQAKGLL